MDDLKIGDKVNLIVPEKFEFDKLPRGFSMNCTLCDDKFTIHSDRLFLIRPVDEDEFKEGYVCHCGQLYNIKYG